LILLQNKHKTISKFIIDKKIQNEQVVCQARKNLMQNKLKVVPEAFFIEY